jgi:hypothetical protein
MGCSKLNINQVLGAIMALGLMNSCVKGDPSFSLLGENTQLSISPQYEVVPTKIDVLWVVENSDSMETSQQALIDNFSRFINRFITKQYDFRIGVTTPDAWLGKFIPGEEGRLRLKDGANGQHSGVFVIDRNTPNLSHVFMVNARQGILGHSDERPFQSVEEVLSFPGNSDFRRPDAFLAVIIISDEDDFSNNSIFNLENQYNDPRIIPISHYKNFFDNLAGIGNYSINAVAIKDQNCLNQLNNGSGAARKIGVRYMQMAEATGGVVQSLCDDFGSSLEFISDTILTKNPVNLNFKLDREPRIETLQVLINGVAITQDPVNGWVYDPATMIVSLHGQAADQIQNGGQINIVFDPLRPKN